MIFGLIVLFCVIFGVSAAAQSIWTIQTDGGIAWEIKRGDKAHQDTIEMSGRKVSSIVTYGVNSSGGPVLSRHIVFPGLRTLPNDTHANLSYTFDESPQRIFVGGRPAREAVNRIHHRGLITIDSTLSRDGSLALRRVLYPSSDKPVYIER